MYFQAIHFTCLTKILKTMKIIKFLLFAFLTVSINSCKDVDPETEPIIELQGEIGQWHNIALDLFFESKEFQDLIEANTFTYDEIKHSIIKVLSQNNSDLFDYSEMMRNSFSSEFENVHPFGESEKLREGKDGRIGFEEVFKYLHDIHEIGDGFFNQLITLNDQVLSNTISKASLINQVHKMQNLNLKKREKLYLEAFIQVMEHSNKYWGREHARIAGEPSRTVGIIWADAAGGLYGMLCGPVCSIVEAALFSTLVAIQ